MTSTVQPTDIAVVGMAAWYPCGSTLKDFWASVVARRRAFRRLPPQRLSADYQDPDPLAPDRTYLTRAALIDGFSFDWAARRIPRQVHDSADLVHWLALEVAIRTVEDAGYSRESLPRERAGVIIGNTLTGEISRANGLRLRWPYVARALRTSGRALGYTEGSLDELAAVTEDVFKSAFPGLTEDTLPGTIPNTIAGRICNYFDLKGGGYAVDGACASSLIAIAQAADALVNRRLDTVLAGGVDISIDPFETIGFAKIGALAREDMYVYEQRSQGFLPGEGCGWVMLKRLEDARRDGDFVYAVLKGWGMSSDGRGGLTAPTVEGQVLAIRRAYESAGYSLAHVDFVEGHGTGTAVGDATELKALAAVLGEQGSRAGTGVTALKSIVGHTKAAAGVGSFIKAVLAVNQRVVPPLAGCERPHSVFGQARLFPMLDGRTSAPDQVMRAGVSAFGFGGINVHTTIESADPPHQGIKTDLDARAMFVSAQDSELFLFRAPSFEALQRQIQAVAAAAGHLSVSELTDLAAHLAHSAGQGDCRAAVVAANPDELSRNIGTLLNLLKAPPAAGQVQMDALRKVWLGNRPEGCRVGFVFPGQGSQELNMARHLVERFEWARDLVAEAEAVVGELNGRRLSDLMLRPIHQANPDELVAWQRELMQTDVCQPAICLASVLYAHYLGRLGVRPNVVGGHSLGELTAFWAAGALSLRELFELARARGACMAAPVGAAGSMASLRCSKEEAARLCREVEGYVVVANVNATQQVVVSGDPTSVDAVLALAADRGIGGQRLQVSNAFHSRYVADAAQRLAAEVRLPEAVPDLSARLFSGLDGAEIHAGEPLRGHFPRQMVEPVEFVKLGAALAGEVDLLLEVGPGRVLSGLLNASGRGLLCLPVEGQPGKHQQLNQALAAFFVYGGALDTSGVFDARYYAEYIPPHERRFVENPCERDLVVPEFADGVQCVAPATADADEQPDEQPDGGAENPTRSLPELVDLLIGLVVDRTGFPRESIGPEMTFLNDLNLESIAAGEIVARAAQAVGAAGQVDPSQLLQASIQQVAEALQLAADPSNPGAPASWANGDASELLDILERLTGRPTWVRAFEVRDTEEPLLVEDANAVGFDEQRVLVVSDPDYEAQAQAIAHAFASRGAVTSHLTYEALRADSAEHRAPAVLVAVLPAVGCAHDASVQGYMERLLIAAQGARASGGTLIYVQWGGGLFQATAGSPLSAAAFAASLHHERSQLRVRVLDFAPEADPRFVAARLIDESVAGAPFARAGYDARGVRRIPRPFVLEHGAGRPRSIAWSERDVIVATGGGRGVTAHLALAMAEHTGATMVLLGRSSAVEDAEIEETLNRFRTAGRKAEYVQCDVTDAEAVGRTLGEIGSKYGPVTGVLHGAGVNRPALVGAENVETAHRAVAPKVEGLLNVLAALEHNGQSLRAVFGLSSIIGVTGMPGNAWYGFANEALDRILRRYQACHPETAVVSVAYSLWEGVGMGVKLGRVAEQVRRLGTSAIPVTAAREHFLRLLERDPKTTHVVVAARLGGLDTWCPDRASPPAMRFLEQVATVQPGVELVVQAHVAPDRDQYLLDHCYKGTYLLPMVHGLEAMAQTVAAVVGRTRLDHVRIENLDLPQPIVVDPQVGEDLLIHAEVLEPVLEREDSETRVAVGIACRRTGFARDHFSATFVLPGNLAEPPRHTIVRPAERLPIDPPSDLYGRFLFHGPRFQRLRNFYVLRSDYSVFDAEQAASTDQDFVLGDPFFRDALLQAGQVVISQTRGLPRGIRCIEVFPPADGASQTRPLVEGVLNERTRDQVLCTLTVVDGCGRVTQRLEQCLFSIVEHLPDEPTAEEIAAPDERDQRRLEEQMRAAAAALRVRAPALAVANLPGLQWLPAAERHARERPVLQRAVESFQGQPAVGSRR